MDQNVTPLQRGTPRPAVPLRNPKRLLVENVAIVALATGSVVVLVGTTTSTCSGSTVSYRSQWQQRQQEAEQAVAVQRQARLDQGSARSSEAQ